MAVPFVNLAASLNAADLDEPAIKAMSCVSWTGLTAVSNLMFRAAVASFAENTIQTLLAVKYGQWLSLDIQRLI